VHVPEPLPSVTPAFTRRQGLTALALLGPVGLIAACSSGSGATAASATATTSASLADEVVREEEGLIATYEAVLAALPDLPAETATLLGTIRDQHAQHRDALGGGSGASPSAAPTAQPSTAADALGILVAAEREASRSRIRACVAAEDPELARLLAFLAASESAHVPALRGVAT
jgi:hypothetical protein